MKTQHEQLYKLLSHFEGMTKLDAFDLLHKMEVLLFYAKSPLKKQQIKNIIASEMNTNTDIDPFHCTILPNGNFCEYLASNDWIHIYKEVRRGLGRLSPFVSYYFKTKYAPLELLKLNPKNLLENVSNTAHEQAIFSFLNNHKITAKDPVTGMFLLVSNSK